MSYKRRRVGGRSTRASSNRYNSGYEAAKKHIREAEELSRELGGTDKDVKSYFFALNGKNLRKIFVEYGKNYGEDKRQYAEEALPHWKSGKRKMSGLVAGRLFALLPRHMPLSKKFELVESLWRFKGPSSHRIIYVGPDASQTELTDIVRIHLEEKVQSYVIDEPTMKRFDWLAENDSMLYQKLKNHFLHLEKNQLAGASFDRIGVMLSQIQNAGTVSQTLTQTFAVGKHRVEIQFSPESNGISYEAPKKSLSQPSSSIDSDNAGCMILVAIILIITVFYGLSG